MLMKHLLVIKYARYMLVAGAAAKGHQSTIQHNPKLCFISDQYKLLQILVAWTDEAKAWLPKAASSL